MSITKYALLRRRLNMTHHAATQVSGMDWRALGMCIYRCAIVLLAWGALMAVLAFVDRYLDEKEATTHEIRSLIEDGQKLAGHLANALNGQPTLISVYGGEEHWLVRCQPIVMNAPDKGI